MSKIGNAPIKFNTDKVKINIEDGGDYGYKKISVNGPLGELSESIRRGIVIKIESDQIIIERKTEEPRIKALHGLYRSLIANMVQGVTEGYKKTLEIHGVGYRGAQKGNDIELNIGFSHSVLYRVPTDVKVVMEDQEKIVVSGTDKQRVGQVAAEIRELRKPEPYKGKGIRYQGEHVRRKAGKAGSV